MFRNQSCPQYFFPFLQPSVQLKHTCNYVLTRVLIQLTNINILSMHTRHTQTATCPAHLSLFPSSIPSYPFGCLYCGALNTLGLINS
ncbi:unnamed protein product [Hymenolepis diminuta]|uniref:Uncharacterized protein n=1 Tax=Hymenolepis diminuta TaxID=6216 RepID=A0A564Y2V5_HYMDI|nr:unnamed protein product [Hymenolepis diminuta]